MLYALTETEICESVLIITSNLECEMPTKKVTIQYRQLKIEGLYEGYELKSVVVDVLRKRRWAHSAKQRIISLDQDGSLVILNKVSQENTWYTPIFAGQIIHLHEGTEVQAVIESLDEDLPEFQLINVDLGETTKVLRGALYFVMVGNHVGLIEGQQVKGRTLERYLTALLQKAGALENSQVIILNSKFTSGDGKELSESSEIIVSAAKNVSRENETYETSETVSREVDGAEARRQATVFEVLKVMGWSEDALESLSKEIPPGGWIEGFFKILMKQSKRRKKNISRATVNEALRNLDPADLGLKGDGSERNGIIKLSVVRDVDTVGSNSLIDPESAMEQIVNAPREWSTQGKIDCRFE